MNHRTLAELEQFVVGFFATHEAVVERRPAGELEVLLPEVIAGRLGIDEHLRLAFGSETIPGCEPIHYGSALLDKLVAEACGSVPVAACVLEFDYVKSAGFERLVAEQFSFVGARCEIRSQGRTLIDYLRLSLRYTAQSDEQKTGLLDLIFNAETGALVQQMGAVLAMISKRPGSCSRDELLSRGRVKALADWAARLAPKLAASEIAPFIESMKRRYQRDSANLEEYYAGLRREMEASLSRAGLSEQLIAERQEKIAALPDELTRKKDDIFKKYSVRVKMEPVALLAIRTPAVKVLCRLAIGRRLREISLIYNPVTKTLDPLVCEGCGNNAVVISFCSAQHLLCPVCSGHCPRCR